MRHDGMLLKRWIEQNGISKTDFADAIGKSRNQLYEYFKVPYLQSKTIVTLCDYMGITPPTREAFYKAIDKPMKSDTVPELTKKIKEQLDATIRSLEEGMKELDHEVSRLRVLIDLLS